MLVFGYLGLFLRAFEAKVQQAKSLSQSVKQGLSTIWYDKLEELQQKHKHKRIFDFCCKRSR